MEPVRAEVAGIPDGLCDTQVRSNPGIDAASALVLRALNERLTEDELVPQDYQRLVKSALAKQGLAERARDDSVRLGIDERWVRRKSREELDNLRQLDLRVVGDIDELEARPVPGVTPRRSPPSSSSRQPSTGWPSWSAVVPAAPTQARPDDLDYAP